MAGGIYSHRFFVYFFFPKDKRKQFCLRGSPSWYYLWMMPHLFLLLLKTCRAVLTNTARTLQSEGKAGLTVWVKSLCTALTGVYHHLGGSQLHTTSVKSGGCLGWNTLVIISCPNYLCMGTDADTSSKKKSAFSEATCNSYIVNVWRVVKNFCICVHESLDIKEIYDFSNNVNTIACNLRMN